MAHWVDHRTPPRRNTALGVGLLIIAALWLVALLAWAGRDAGATQTCEYTGNGCTTTTPYVTTTQPTTTTAATTTIATTTTAATTTVPATTTTAGTNCGLCGGQSSTPTTVPVTTTVAATTTVPPTTTVPVPDTTPEHVTVPDAPTTTVAPTADTLPVTGSSLWLAVFGVCLLALGGLAVAWKRTA